MAFAPALPGLPVLKSSFSTFGTGDCGPISDLDQYLIPFFIVWYWRPGRRLGLLPVPNCLFSTFGSGGQGLSGKDLPVPKTCFSGFGSGSKANPGFAYQYQISIFHFWVLVGRQARPSAASAKMRFSSFGTGQVGLGRLPSFKQSGHNSAPANSTGASEPLYFLTAK